MESSRWMSALDKIQLEWLNEVVYLKICNCIIFHIQIIRAVLQFDFFILIKIGFIHKDVPNCLEKLLDT
jgi:hypothetical protein